MGSVRINKMNISKINKKRLLLILLVSIAILFSGCIQGEPAQSIEELKPPNVSENDYPKIASWLS